MSTTSVRDQVLAQLKALGIVVKARLPEVSGMIVRAPREVAVRVVELYALVAISMPDVPAREVSDWLKEVGLWAGMCAEERELFRRAPNGLSDQERRDMSWMRESMYVLGWSLALLDSLRPPYRESDADALLPLIPPQVSVQTFLNSAQYRPIEDIYLAVDLHYCIHSAIRNGDGGDMDEAVVRERRQALEWLMSEAQWGDVPLDT